jgi:hypothetical protein
MAWQEPADQTAPLFSRVANIALRRPSRTRAQALYSRATEYLELSDRVDVLNARFSVSCMSGTGSIDELTRGAPPRLMRECASRARTARHLHCAWALARWHTFQQLKAFAC